MRADADFMVFVAARWPSLVTEAVLLGVPPEEAADATADALSRCRRDWERASREEDVGAMVRGELEAAARRRPRTDEAGRERAARELVVLAPPTLEELRRKESQNNRARLKRAALVAVPLLLVAAGAGAYFAADDPEAPTKAPDGTLGNAAISREENPAPGTVWYADGQLHLDHTVLAIDGLRDMTRLGVGVVYGDDAGRVVFAADDGTREVLGHKDPVVPVAATDENGWAAWVETAGDEPEIVVKEASTGNPVETFPVDVSARVVALDGETVYYVDDEGAHYVQPSVPTARSMAPADLLDVRSRIQVFQLDPGRVFVVQSIFNQQFDLPGQGAQLAPDGGVVVTHTPGTEDYAAYDTRTGQRLPSGLSEGDHVVAVAPGRRGTIAYIVAPVASPHRMTPGRDLELRTCDLAQGECVTDAHIPNFGRSPVLAR